MFILMEKVKWVGPLRRERVWQDSIGESNSIGESRRTWKDRQGTFREIL